MSRNVAGLERHSWRETWFIVDDFQRLCSRHGSLDMTVTIQLLEDSPTVLSLGHSAKRMVFLRVERSSNTVSFWDWQDSTLQMRWLRAYHRSWSIKENTPYEFSRRFSLKNQGVGTRWTRNHSSIEDSIAGLARMVTGIKGILWWKQEPHPLEVTAKILQTHRVRNLSHRKHQRWNTSCLRIFTQTQNC